MTTLSSLPGGTAHATVPADLARNLLQDSAAVRAWQSLTPLARNEWICWVEDAVRQETRARRIERVRTELLEGIRRPCCWIGCTHRTDKAVSPSIQWVLSHKKKKYHK